jgi:hypothetical protein
MEDIAHSTALLEAYLRIQKEQPLSREEIRDAYENIRKLEPVIGDCIARINMGLKPARMRVFQDLTRAQGDVSPLQSRQVERNDPCPCGSGKKYKRCCGLRH